MQANQAHTSLHQKRQKPFHLWHTRVDTQLGQTVNQKSHFDSHFIHFQSTVRQHNFLSLQRRYCVVSRLWTVFSHSDCKRSLPGTDNKIPSSSSGMLELVIVSKTGLCAKPSSSNFNYLQTRMDPGDEGRSALNCRRTRYGQKWF